MTSELSGCRISRRISLANEKDYVLLCSGPKGTQKLAGWTLAEPHPVKIALANNAGQNIRLVNGLGEVAGAMNFDSGRLVFELSAMPKYVSLGGATVADAQ
jgi:hypothetical protein